MTFQATLGSAKKAWEDGYTILARLVDIALEQAGRTERVNVDSEPVDVFIFKEGWHREQAMDDAAEELFKCYELFLMHLRALSSNIRRFPGGQVHKDDPEKFLNNPANVQPWALLEEAVPCGRMGSEPNSENLAQEIADDLDEIFRVPAKAPHLVEMIERNALRWRRWFQKQSLTAEPAASSETPDESPTEPTAKKRGPNPKYDTKKDKRIYDAWKNGSGHHKNLYDLAGAFKISYSDVKKTLGRVRYHKRKTRKGRAE
jgi:hypothetical protein